MKHTFSLLIFITLFNSHTSFAMDKQKMDFDKEEGIPLAVIYKSRKEQSTTKQPLLDEQFIALEQRIRAGYFSDGTIKGWWNTLGKIINAEQYFDLVKKELPSLIASEELIKKYHLLHSSSKSLFGAAIENLISSIRNRRFNNVDCDTLAAITNPDVPCKLTPITNALPLVLKKYLIERAYEGIKEHYSLIDTAGQNFRTLDIHGKLNVAATASDDGIFKIWDLLTGSAEILPIKAVNGIVKFSSNGSQLMTGTLAQKEPETILIHIWDVHTKTCMHTIEHRTLLHQWYFENKPDGTDTLLFFDNKGYMSLYKLQKNTEPIRAEYMEVGTVTTQKLTLTDPGDYFFTDDRKNLCKYSTPYWFCQKAIENTKEKQSLRKVADASVYQSLTRYEKELVEKDIALRIATLNK